MKKSNITKIVVGLILLAIFILTRYNGLGEYINLASLKHHRDAMRDFVSYHYGSSIFIFMLSYALAVAFSFPFASLITLTGGMLFGAIPGAIYTNIGATAGASIAFLLYRYVFGDWIQERYKDRLAHITTEIEKNGVWYLIMIRMIAVVPFFVANALISMTPTSLFTFAWTTSVGIIPGSLVYSFAGEQLDSIDSVRDIFSPEVLLAFGLLGLLAIMPIVLKRFRGEKV